MQARQIGAGNDHGRRAVASHRVERDDDMIRCRAHLPLAGRFGLSACRNRT
jgi:hypothetical protein